jgi:hypothetical protein
MNPMAELRKLMKACGISVKDLAIRLDMKYSTVNSRLLGYSTPSGAWLVECRTMIAKMLDERKQSNDSV